MLLRRVVTAILLCLAVERAVAGGPRYVTGPPFFKTSGNAVGWKQKQLLYFTDPGDLGPAVNHQAADALVAAAAAVWNVPIASITVGQGGALAEHVSGQNVYLGSTGMVWPTDVLAANASGIPVAVVYDNDGSVTDTLLGGGASDPAGCEQNAVTESVDAFDPEGYILHAVIVLNGRCTGTAPEQQLQMQYQLMRVFGRVLGLAWSQTNDNVFTGSPTPTYDQALHWPVMHPIDIRCGPYSFQCMAQPFVLRPDDVQALVSVYPVTGTPAAGKQVSLADGNWIYGTVTFPTGQGMAGVNVLTNREYTFTSTPQDWFESSTMSGTYFRRNALSPFVSADTSASGSEGSTSASNEGYFLIPYMQVQGVYAEDTVFVSTEPVNALYAGEYSLGPYTLGVVVPAGSAPTVYGQGQVHAGAEVQANFTIGDAPSVCGSGADGTAGTPMLAPASGWWTGQICGYGHVSYIAAAIKAGRSFTVEVTALDANGFATTTKLMPAIGIYAVSDAVGALPSLGVQTEAFNGLDVGTTTLQADLASGTGVRIGIADERGDGRPDFPYQARLFYADSIAPVEIASAGGQATISGTGFRSGNQVLVNGIAVPVQSWSATSIVLNLPDMQAVGAVAGTPVDVAVTDAGTGAASTITGVLTYQAAGVLPAALELVSAPSGTAFVGQAAATPFAVRLVASDDVTPVSGQAVVFSASGAGAQFGACTGTTCTLTTDANGLAQTAVKPTAAGLVTLEAVAGALSTGAVFTSQMKAISMQLMGAPVGPLVVGKAAAQPLYVVVRTGGGQALVGDLVTFSVAPGSTGTAVFGGCNATPCGLSSNVYGQAIITVTATSAGTITLVATEAGGLTQRVTLTAVSQPDTLSLLSAASFSGYVNQTAGQMLVEAVAGDGSGVLRGSLVTFSAPPGVILSGCGAQVCQFNTDYFGQAGTGASASQPGTYTVTATMETASASVTYTFAPVPPPQFSIVSVPSGLLTAGVVASTPFSVRLVDGFGRPETNVTVTLSAPPELATLGCGWASCSFQTDGNGVVSTMVTPERGGALVLNAASAGVAPVFATLTVAGGVPALTILKAPPPTVTAGSAVQLVVRLTGANGSPQTGVTTWVTTIAGTLANPTCTNTVCKYYTDANGMLSVGGTAWTPGTVTLSVTAAGMMQQVSFTVLPKAMSMKLAASPTAHVVAGTSASPFAVEIVGADGITPMSGENVTFSIANDSAGLAACPAVPCVVKTGANGLASTGAIATSTAGPVSLIAMDNGMSLSAGFTVTPKPDVLTLVAAPSVVFGSMAAATSFVVKVTLADGLTPVAGVTVGFSANGTGTVQFAACGASTCSMLTDANGLASSVVSGGARGAVTLSATAQLSTGNQTVTAALSVAASQGSMRLISGPGGSVVSGTAALPLVVKVVAPDGVTPAVGKNVTFSVSSGAATFAICSSAPCVGITGVDGIASTGSIGTSAAGPVTLVASVDGMSVSAGYVVTPKPDLLTLVGAPASLFEGTTGAVAFAAKVMLADGVTPAAGVPLLLAASGSGSAQFTICGAASCTVSTDASGMVTSAVMGVSAGAVALRATAQLATGDQAVSAALTVVPNVRNVTALEPVTYVAESATVTLELDLVAVQNGGPAGSQTVTWSGQGAYLPGSSTSVTDASGKSAVQAAVGPLIAGQQASVSACAWTTICTQFAAQGVAAGVWQLRSVSGGTQNLSEGVALAPVVVQVTDGAGHVVAGAPVTVGQTMTALIEPCPSQGRCPAVPGLASEVTVATTDLNGRVTVMPLSIPGVATQTAISFSSGTQGFLTAVLTDTP